MQEVNLCMKNASYYRGGFESEEEVHELLKNTLFNYAFIYNKEEYSLF